ncbi:MAG: hypothetical protein F6K18_30650 [Okeania sp. SIO2C2]|uniref:hypothetical protein n=1 Tax=Okeania sp. SIO2C2 TaxID=2607787 RepID=UPI0013B9516C|nr:hypothetical protein [Okeania sp. SIO2C2]NEP90818.1 hypothetical protein [Okeania sp. SIO2C2]
MQILYFDERWRRSNGVLSLYLPMVKEFLPCSRPTRLKCWNGRGGFSFNLVLIFKLYIG